MMNVSKLVLGCEELESILTRRLISIGVLLI